MPIKFNGGAWLSSRPSVDADASAGPDTRDWGPSNWWYATLSPYVSRSLLLSLRCDALQAKPAFALRPYARGWRLGGAGPCRVWWGAHLYQPGIVPPLLQDVLFDYFLRMMPLLHARSAVLLPPSNASATGVWQTETATVFGAYTQVFEHGWSAVLLPWCCVPRCANSFHQPCLSDRLRHLRLLLASPCFASNVARVKPVRPARSLRRFGDGSTMP